MAKCTSAFVFFFHGTATETTARKIIKQTFECVFVSYKIAYTKR